MFKQIKSIPMGGNASPLIAALTNIDRLVSSKSLDSLRLAKKLSNNSRIIDDTEVCNTNDINDFVLWSQDIYPNSILLLLDV